MAAVAGRRPIFQIDEAAVSFQSDRQRLTSPPPPLQTHLAILRLFRADGSNEQSTVKHTFRSKWRFSLCGRIKTQKTPKRRRTIAIVAAFDTGSSPRGLPPFPLSDGAAAVATYVTYHSPSLYRVGARLRDLPYSSLSTLALPLT